MSESELSTTPEAGWVPWFCGLEDHQFLAEVEGSFLRDPFNHSGLRKQFSHFKLTHQRSSGDDSVKRLP